MPRFLALVEHDPHANAYGVLIPDCLGCTAMGVSFDEAEANAIEALREWCADQLVAGRELPRARDIVELRTDSSLLDDFTPSTIVVSLPAYVDGARPMRVNVSMEAWLVSEIDEAARRRGLTRSAFLASAARDKIAFDRGLTSEPAVASPNV